MPAFLRALNSRNYRLYFAGQLISLAGTWMQQIAMIWLAYRLSNSAFVLGTIGFASQIPILVFGSFGGVWVDRLDRRRLMIWTQAVAMLQAVLLAVLAGFGLVTPVLLIGLAFLLGCVNALDVPVRQAIAVQLVDDPEHLPNAIALNSMLMNGGRFVGPALAGIVVAAFGETACFVLNAASYLAVLLALGAIRLEPMPPRAQAPALQAFREGIAYAMAHPFIRRSLLLVASISFLATPYAVMLPVFAREIFGGDARTYGFLVGSAGAGSLAGSLLLATHGEPRRIARWVAWAAPAVGACLAGFALTPWHALAVLLLMGVGFAVILAVAGSNVLIQTRVEDAFRGRVMALYSMAFLGVAPLGSFAVGSFGHVLGIRATLAACGVASLACGLVYRHAARRAMQAATAGG